MTAVLKQQDTPTTAILYMVLELSDKQWKLGFSNGEKTRQHSIDAGDWGALTEKIGWAKAKFKLGEECRIVSCYEAGRDGFWIHRALTRVRRKPTGVPPNEIHRR